MLTREMSPLTSEMGWNIVEIRKRGSESAKAAVIELIAESGESE